MGIDIASGLLMYKDAVKKKSLYMYRYAFVLSISEVEWYPKIHIFNILIDTNCRPKTFYQFTLLATLYEAYLYKANTVSVHS